jgi:hypothetical protein
MMKIVVYREFAKEKDSQDKRAEFLEKKRKIEMARQLEGYLDWIVRAGWLNY